MDEQIVRGIVAGLFGGIVVLMIVFLKKPSKCPKCGFVLPRFRKPQNRQQAMWGGWSCPKCNTAVDRKGNVVIAAPTGELPADLPRDETRDIAKGTGAPAEHILSGPTLRVREGAIKEKLSAIRASFGILENAYLCSSLGASPKELAEIDRVLATILAEGDIGLLFLVERLMSGITLSGTTLSLQNWGEDTWNELLKKQTIIKALGAAKAKGALSDLERLSNATCSYGQWNECIKGPLARAIAAIRTA